MVDSNLELSEKLRRAFWLLQSNGTTQSLLKRYFTQEVFDLLCTRITPSGASLLDVIQSGIQCPDSSIGIYAPDPDSYACFSPLFDPIIEHHHGITLSTVGPFNHDLGNLSLLPSPDKDGKYILSTRVRLCRNISGFPFNPMLSDAQYLDIESLAREALTTLPTGMDGNYLALRDVSAQKRDELIDQHFLFNYYDEYMEKAGGRRHWPMGRGVFLNQARTFMVWVNEEDHLRIISMEEGSNLSAVYHRLATGVRALEKQIEFARDDKLGYLTFCPTNLGTTMRASVHIKLPGLAKDRHGLEKIAASYGLQVRGTHGEHSEVEDDVFDISNMTRLGVSEWMAIKKFKDGISGLISAEENMG